MTHAVRVIHVLPAGRRLGNSAPLGLWPPAKVLIEDVDTRAILTWALTKAESIDGVSANAWLKTRGYEPVLGSAGIWARPTRRDFGNLYLAAIGVIVIVGGLALGLAGP